MLAPDVHVYPLDDLQEHITDGPGCPCDPSITVDGDHLLYVHNAFDHREIVEQAIAILNGDDDGPIPEDPHESPAVD